MSADDIRNRLVKYIQSIDDSVDLAQGPIYDLMLQPVPDEIDIAAANAAHLMSLYGRISDPAQLSSSELEAIALNLRVVRTAGTKATVDLRFVLSTAPVANVTIPAGTAVGTADFKYVFVTNYAVTVTPDTAYAFYNSKTGKYEVYVSATAQNVGSGYNLPLGKINTLVRPITSVQSVTSTVAATGGSDNSDDYTFFNRIQTALNGMDPSSLSSYFNAVYQKTAYKDSMLFVSAADRTRFRRRVVGNAYDVYVETPGYATVVDEFSYTSGDKTFKLQSGPVYGIQYVSVNGTTIALDDWEFTRDTSIEFAGSVAGKNYVDIGSTLAKGDTIRIYYTVNKNCLDIQQALNSLNAQGVSFLVREMKQVPIKLTVALSVTQVTPTLLDTATELVSNLINSGQLESLSVYDIQSILTGSIQSVRTVTVSELHKKSDSTNTIQNISLAFDETATLDTTNGDLTITATT